MKTTASNLKVRQIIRMMQSETLVPRADFQRRLVWTTEDKNNFIDTVLKGYPFPEIYLANGDVDTMTGDGKQLLVDGQQRVSTLFEYFVGPKWKLLQGVPAYSSLDEDGKKEFLDYDVAVRDLGNVNSSQIIEVFRRINATKYSLNDIEINNAVYAGALKSFGETVASMPFFENHRVFRNDDLKRMGDLRFALQLVVTMLAGYFNRDEEVEAALSQYNDDFAPAKAIEQRILRSIDLIDRCGFSDKSRVWKKGDLFSIFIEIDRCFESGVILRDELVGDNLLAFYDAVDSAGASGVEPAVAVYYKASVQANNDRLNRVRRGRIIFELLNGRDPNLIVNELT